MSALVRRAAVVTVAIVLGCLGLAAPAWADGPVAGSPTLTVSPVKVTSIDLSQYASDPNGPLTYAVDPPSHGQLSDPTGSQVTFTPPAQPGASDTFDYTVDDGTDTATGTVTLDYNNVPTAGSPTLTVSPVQATVIDLAAYASDADANTVLTYSITAPPTSGTYTLAGSQLTYHPTVDATPPDSFTYRVDDGTDTASGTVTLDYNTVPTAGSPALSVSPVKTTDIDLSQYTSDADGDSLSYRVGTPSSGRLSAPSGSHVTFTPPAHPGTSDTFTYTVDDGTDTATGTVTLDYNTVPTAGSPTLTVSPTKNSTIDLSQYTGDADGDSLAYTVDPPSSGSLTHLGPAVSFSPPAHPTAPTTFSYTVDDGTDTATGTVTLSYNAAPTAASPNLTASPIHPTTIDLSHYVTDGDASSTLTYTVGSPSHGQLSTPSAAQVVFTPPAHPGTSDSFSYTVDDGTDTATGTITLTYNAVPIATSPSRTISARSATLIDLSQFASDADLNTTLTYSISASPGKGSFSGSGSQLTYHPAVDAAGSDSFSYQVSDGIDSAVGTVSLTFNQVPTTSDYGSAATPIKIAAKAVTSLNLASRANDPDHTGTLTYSVVSQPAHGAVSFNGPTATYDPTGTPTGSDSYTFRVTDGIDFSNTSTVTVVYNAVPQAQGQSATVSGLRTTDFALSGLATDGDGDPLTFSIAQQPAHGSATMINATTARYTPTNGYAGADPFKFGVTDGLDPVTATINIRVNDVPEAVGPGSTVSVPFDSSGKAIPLHVDDSDTGDSHTFSVVGSPAKGSVQINGSTATYTPDTGATGPDSFSFKVSDGIDSSAPLTVDVNIAQAPDRKPHAANGSASLAFDGKVSITLQGRDPDPGDALTYAITKGPKHGTVSSGNKPLRTYTADKGFAGTDEFTFQVRDLSRETDTATVTVTVGKARTTVQSVMFSPAHPTPGRNVSAQVTLSTLGSVRGAKLTLQEGSHSHSVTMSGRTATVPLGQLSAGSHTFKIRYAGTTTTARTTATALPIKVAKAVSSLRVSSTPKQLTTKDRGVATVHVSAGGAPVDGALVTIKEGSTTLGSAVVRNAVAKITLPKFGLGQHNLMVSYAGNKDVTGATKSWIVRVALG